MAYKQTPDELAQHLREQIVIMRANAAQCDAGDEFFAKPISTVLLVLLHGGRAFLRQLGTLDQLRFVNSAGEINPEFFDGESATHDDDRRTSGYAVRSTA